MKCQLCGIVWVYLCYSVVVVRVPNIVDISYGRDVGYSFTEHDLGKDIHNISATKIRSEMRKKKELE